MDIKYYIAANIIIYIWWWVFCWYWMSISSWKIYHKLLIRGMHISILKRKDIYFKRLYLEHVFEITRLYNNQLKLMVQYVNAYHLGNGNSWCSMAIIQKEDVIHVKLNLMLSIHLISALRSYTNTMENTVTWSWILWMVVHQKQTFRAK